MITLPGLIAAVIIAYACGLATPLVWAYLQFLGSNPKGSGNG